MEGEFARETREGELARETRERRACKGDWEARTLVHSTWAKLVHSILAKTRALVHTILAKTRALGLAGRPDSEAVCDKVPGQKTLEHMNVMINKPK